MDRGDAVKRGTVCGVHIGRREWYVELATEALPSPDGFVPGRRFLQLVYVRGPKGGEGVHRRDLVLWIGVTP